MFANLITALQGAPANDSDDEAGESPGAPATNWTAGLSGLASGLAETVRSRTSEIAQSVTTTDWASELNAFTSEVKRDAETVGKEAVHAVEHLPDAAKGIKASSDSASPSMSKLDLDEVGSGLSKFGQSLFLGTSEIFSEVTKTVTSEIDKASKIKRDARGRGHRTAISAVNGKYSRLETEVSAMQRDSGTYCDEPQDAEDYQAFLQTFFLADKKGDIEELLKTNTFMSELQSRIVPVIVEYNVFWNRYFYRLSKLQEKHEKRQAVAQRAQIPQEAEEDLGWGDEDEEELTAPSPARKVSEEAVEQVVTAVEEPAADEDPASHPTSTPAHSSPSHQLSLQPAGPAESTKGHHETPETSEPAEPEEPLAADPGSPEAGAPVPHELPRAKVQDACDPSSSNSSETASGGWRIVHSPTEAACVNVGTHSDAQKVESAAALDEDGGWDDFDDDDDDDNEADLDNTAQPASAPVASPGANDDDDDDDDIDEDWGSSA